MGSSESKIAVATPRPERSGQIRNERICRLVDPRSPSAGIDRTPIQVGEFATRGAVRVESEGPVSTSDPRSPTPGISRTPMKDVMRATVSSFARRLGLAFLNEEGDSNDPLPPLTFSKLKNLNLDEDGEMDSAEPLLPPNPPLSAAVSPGVCSPGASVCDSLTLSTQDSGFSAEEEEEQEQVDVEAKQFLDVGDVTADVRGGGKNAGNENRGQVARQKQRERCGKALVNEVRSPLQILKETNSPRDHASQLKLKIATPERQRLEQTDRRALSLSLDKENQR
ncbi:hypothetical protein MATL_G00128150 [Megalops atlanticus]|uniref:Uncharacterized protein n=1 Tax=Megalops atlanticus TaxID=7932 RepID=A0A9D3T6W0_MEGAT|nr:hypothetical protein MATL_G00128150 [Megalops atlanticus]